MAQSVEFDLKQLVLVDGSFGPREVQQMVDASASDYSQYQVLHEAVAELEAREDESPARNVRLVFVCTCLAATGGRWTR